MTDSHDHSYDWKGVPGSGSPDRFAGDVPDGPTAPAGYPENTDDPFGQHEIGSGWTPVSEGE
jgi:hypothetical protein